MDEFMNALENWYQKRSEYEKYRNQDGEKAHSKRLAEAKQGLRIALSDYVRWTAISEIERHETK